MSLENSGADYLRRLKTDLERPTAHSPSPGGTHLETETVSHLQSVSSGERRQNPRYPCEGSAEFRVGGTDVRTWGTFRDLSLNGCYVEMTATFPVEAMLDLNLELHGVQVRTKGEVRVSYPFLGIGIAFREMTDENRVRLRQMVRSLLPPSRTGLPRTSVDTGSTEDGALPVIVNPALALQSLVEFFQVHSVMSKEEFLQALRKSQPAR